MRADDARKLSHETLEEVRKRAVARVQAGESPEVVGGVSFSTHMMPLKVMVDYISQSIKCKTMIIGIQPKVLKFGSIPSKGVINSAKEVAKTILEIL